VEEGIIVSGLVGEGEKFWALQEMLGSYRKCERLCWGGGDSAMQ